jgi:hypothetical protein
MPNFSPIRSATISDTPMLDLRETTKKLNFDYENEPSSGTHKLNGNVL